MKTDAKGKEKKVYDVYVTPFERLKSLPQARLFLKRGVSFRALNRIARAESDTQFARQMQTAKRDLLRLCAQAGASSPVPLQTAAEGQPVLPAPPSAQRRRRRRGGPRS